MKTTNEAVKVGTKVSGLATREVRTVVEISAPDRHGDRVVRFDDGSVAPLWIVASGQFTLH